MTDIPKKEMDRINASEDPLGSLMGYITNKIDAPNAAPMPAMPVEQQPKQESMAMPALSMETEVESVTPPKQEVPAAKPEFIESYPAIAQSEALDTNIFDSVQYVESRNLWDAKSSSGALGVMQIKPDVSMKPGYGVRNIFEIAEDLGINTENIPKNETGAKELLYDPEVNRTFGEEYLNAMYKRFNNSVTNALVAYKEGPGYTRKWLEKGGNYEDLKDSAKRYLHKINRHLQGEDVYGPSTD